MAMVTGGERRMRTRRRGDVLLRTFQRHVYVALAIMTVFGAVAFGEVQNGRAAACHSQNRRIGNIGASIEKIVNGAPPQQRAAAQRELKPLFDATKPVGCPASFPFLP